MNRLGQQIIQARKNRGISQEQLAESSKINLRTLQRIEKGQTNPHGETLKRISEALGIPLIDMVNYGLKEDYGYIKAMHFAALIFILLPLGNILLPIIFWVVKKNQIKDLSFFANKLLNFQITWSLFVYLPILIYLFSAEGSQFTTFIDNLSRLFTWILLPLMYVINSLYLIMAILLIKDQRRNIFPVAIPFLRYYSI
jgi:transcriptional regulator with XRE-family HTH domain